MWYYKLTNSFLQAYIIPAILRQVKFSLGTRIPHYTEAATDHNLCYHRTIDELLNPETDKRLVLLRLYASCVIRVWFKRKISF